MAGFAIDGDWQLNATNSDLQMVAGAEAVAQRIRIGLETFAPYYPFDANAGIPYFSEIFGSNPDLQVIRRLLLDFMLGFPEVFSVDSLELDLDREQRELLVRYDVTLQTGETYSSDYVYGT